ncbi:30S ribosomal protein S9 [Mycoplasma ovis str. Michigan]|uniref:30S ribosomal protein S9 n=1 Tax=Mycoplasma ovis str. Michigan TaxID=1415773 RepID=A0ABM5P0M3_9MOLU|nr:30S ribosomal protein S9 [Mycoplasma ovis]AHC39988.1 30S ribosomal protein S9 [Mycoplasma ovis str. Michigan]
MSTEIRAFSKRKKSRVNIILTQLPKTEVSDEKSKHELLIYVKKDGEYKVVSPLEYFKDEYLMPVLLSPFSFLPARVLGERYSVKAYTKGGGVSAQAQAIMLAIARALLEYYPEIRVPLKKAKLLTQDHRVKERKKIGKYKARRSPQFTKR